MAQVKRQYDASTRRSRAAQTHDAVVAEAQQRFLVDGIGETRMSQIASATGVSVEYLYKRWGGKAGLVREVVARALEGTGAEPAESRSDALVDVDARTLAHAWGRLSAEVAPLVAPVLLLVRQAAASHPMMAALVVELDASRRARMLHNARRLAASGELRAGVDVEQAGDVLWTFSSPELYDLLVVRRGWSLQRYADFVTRGIVGELLHLPASPGRSPGDGVSPSG